MAEIMFDYGVLIKILVFDISPVADPSALIGTANTDKQIPAE